MSFLIKVSCPFEISQPSTDNIDKVFFVKQKSGIVPPSSSIILPVSRIKKFEKIFNFLKLVLFSIKLRWTSTY